MKERKCIKTLPEVIEFVAIDEVVALLTTPNDPLFNSFKKFMYSTSSV